MKSSDIRDILAYWWEQISRKGIKWGDENTDYKVLAAVIKRALQSLAPYEVIECIDYFFFNIPLSSEATLRNALSNYWITRYKEDKGVYL